MSSDPGMTWPPISSEAPRSLIPNSSSWSLDPTTWKFLNVNFAGRPLKIICHRPPSVFTILIAMSRLSGSM